MFKMTAAACEKRLAQIRVLWEWLWLLFLFMNTHKHRARYRKTKHTS